MKKGMLFAVLAVSLFGASPCSCAENKTPSKYDLYSWKVGNDWNYSLVPSTNEHKATAEIKNSGRPLHGAGQVKEKLLDMKEGDNISWQERAESGMLYPPPLVMQDITDYAQTVGVKVVVRR